MRTLLLAVLLLAYPIRAIAGTAVVRVVDASWRPFPGASVAFIATTDCAQPAPGFTGARYADVNGLIEFDFGNSAAYWLMVQGGSGFRFYRECIDLGRSQPEPDRAYFQVRVTLDPLDGPKAESDAQSGSALTRITALVGAYRDKENQGYQVGLYKNALSLEGPDGKILLFPRRDGSTYSGEHGTVTFTFRRGAPTIMRFEPRAIETTRDTSQMILELKPN
jgi:hypothetical protein